MPNIRDLLTIADNNVNRFPENMARQLLNDKLRELEASLRGSFEELPWFEFSTDAARTSNTEFTCTGDLTGLLKVGRSVRAVGSTTGDIEGEITNSVHASNVTTVTVVWNSGQMENESLNIFVNIGGGDAADSIVTQSISASQNITAQNDNALFLVDASGGTVQLTTPAVAGISNGFYFHVGKTDSSTNLVTIASPASATFNGNATFSLSVQHQFATIVFDGTNFRVAADANRPLNNGEVTTSKIGDGQIIETKLADDAVSLRALAHGTGGKVLGFAPDGTPAYIDNGRGQSAARITHIDLSDATSGAASVAFATASDEIWAMGTGTGNANGSHYASAHNLPRKVSGFPSTKAVSKIVSGYNCHYVLTTDGKVYAWGLNTSGQLGLGNTDVTAQMEQITALDGVTIVDIVVPSSDSGTVPCAFFLTDTGTVYSCGSNTYGILGQGASPADNTTATLIPGLTGVANIAVSADTYPHVVTVQTDGTVRSWGYNASGQLGIGNTSNQNTPQTPSSITGIASASVSSGGDGATNSGFSILLKTDGTLMGAGENKSGQLGQGNTTDLSSFTNITLAATITKISTSGGPSGIVVAIDDAANMWSWGYNFYGQQGLGTTTNQTTPQKLAESWQGSVVDAKTIGDEFYNAIVVHTGNAAYAAGYSGSRNLVTGSVANTNNTFQPVLGVDGTISEISSFGSGTSWGQLYLMSDGRLLGGGYNSNGELGIGNNSNQSSLQPVKGFVQKANKPLPRDRGTWATATDYFVGDLIDIGTNPTSRYICEADHASSSSTEPGTGADWADYWVLLARDGADGAGAGADSVDNTILANMAEGTVKGRQAGGGSGDPEDLTPAQLRAIVGVSDDAYGAGWDGSLLPPTQNAVYDQIESISVGGVTDGDKGDIVVSSSGSLWAIDNDSVNFDKLLNASASNLFIGRATSGAGAFEELTATQARSILNVEDGATGDQTGSEIKALYEAEANTNALTDSLLNKLNSIDATHYLPPVADTTALTALTEASLSDKARVYVESETTDFFYDAQAVSGDYAPDDQTGGTGWWRKVTASGDTAASIKTKYESNADTNALTDALLSKLNNVEALADVTDSVNVGAAIAGAAAKTTPVDADLLGLIDSAASNALKTLSWSNVKAALKTYFDGFYAAISHNHSAGDITSGTLPLNRGGTNATTAAAARTSLGVDAAGTDNAPAASNSVAGKIEIATTAETTTGTDALRAVTPDGLAGSVYGIKEVEINVIEYATAVATGDGKAYIHIPPGLDGFNIDYVHARTITAGVGGTMSIQIHNVTDAVDVLSTLLTIDATETGSDTATPAVINATNDDVAENDLLRVDIDAVHSTTPAQGLIVTIGFKKP